MITTKKPSGPRHAATKEIALLSGFLFLGLVILPMVIYVVGQSVFGAYGGVGYADFVSTLSAKIIDGDIVAWFLVLSPYLGLQCLRLTVLAWRTLGRA